MYPIKIGKTWEFHAFSVFLSLITITNKNKQNKEFWYAVSRKQQGIGGILVLRLVSSVLHFVKIEQELNKHISVM